jgi:putative transposase
VERWNRQDIQALDWQAMPEVDASALSEAGRARYERYRQTLERYLRGDALSDIEKQCGVRRTHLYRLIKRCLAMHADGRCYGYRGLLPQIRVNDYCRLAPLKAMGKGGSRGTAGAFAALLHRYPPLRDWMRQQIRTHQVVLHQVPGREGFRTWIQGIVTAHQRFVLQCRALGIGLDEYPLNTDRKARGALTRAFKAELLRNFGTAAHAAGARHLKGLPRSQDDRAPVPTQPLEVVEFDGHRLDLRLKIVVRDPLGSEHELEIERIWILVILDVYTRTVLGYHLCLGREYSRYDVIRTIERALEPHRPMHFTLPAVGYGAKGAFASTKFPELGYATWRWMKIDNAKANLAQDTLHALCEFLGCFVDAGPVYTPDERPYIERFFGTLASTVSSRLPGYTGSNARDIRRALSAPYSTLRLFVSISELEQLIEASLAGYNAAPHSGLHARSPLEIMEDRLRTRTPVLQWLPESKRRTLCLMQVPKRVRVRGYLGQGVRPHVNFYGVRYTSAVLAATSIWVGKDVRLYYNSRDLRRVRAFLADGTEVGELQAQGAWGEFVHDIELRRVILRERDLKRLAAFADPSFLEAFVTSKIASAKRSRRLASELARTIRALAMAPTAASPLPTSSPPPVVVPDPTAPSPKIEPLVLTIGSGYAG